MKIGILKTDDVRESLVDDFGEYPDMFGRLLHEVDATIECVGYDVLRLEYPDDVDEVDAYLITGSKASVYDDEEWIRRLGRFVQKLHRRKKKLIGICFGHQLVAHVLGGRTEKSSEGWLIGVQRHALNDEGLALTGLTEGFDVICSHQDQVVVPAIGSVTLAGSEKCPVAMCRVGDHILTIQGHPEFSPEYSRNLFSLRREQLGDQLVDEGINSLKVAVDNERMARWIVDFFR
ncbi:MAG: GMP synthase [Candidatus Hydrogenedentota bacterium]